MANQAIVDKPFPITPLKTLGGNDVTLGKPQSNRWQLVVVYRGLHCPICKKYLGQLNDMKKEFEKFNVQIITVSTDPEEKARIFADEVGLDIDVAYGLTIKRARELGLYISTPLDSTETDQPFAEPGLFLIRPDGGLHVVEVSSAPFCRPDLAFIKMGVEYVVEKNYPPRGVG